jgi:hypothetical protein
VRATFVRVIVAIALVGSVSACVPPSPGEFVALTYNVAGLPEPFSGSEPDINTPLISPLLNDYDLVLVQEDWADPTPPIPGIDLHHDDLISQATHPFLSEPAPQPLGTDPRRPTALVADGLNHLSRFRTGNVTRVMWTNCFGGANTADGGAADCLSQKGFSYTRATIGGVIVDVYNLHGEAGSTTLDRQYRAADYQQLATFMNEHSAGRPVIVGGDFNLHTGQSPDSGVWATFLDDTGLTDVCDTLECGSDSDEIDKFAYRSSSTFELEPQSHRFERDVFVRSDGEPLSDHDALAVTFAWERL